MKRIFSIFTGLLAIPAWVMGQALPTMPSGGPDNGVYDKGGRYPAGAITSVSYYSPSQGANDTMYVYLPPGYTTSKKYPVIYGYPGISAGADTIFAGWCVGAGTVADNLIGEGKIQPLIIVAIDDNNGDVQSDTLNVIIPYIDSHYSTYADADHRGLYGYSWGGGYTFNIGCGNLNTFRHLSPSSAAPNKAGDDSLFPNGGAEAKQKLKTLLISCGNADYLGLYGSSEGAHNYCVANGIPHAWWPVKNGNHDAGVWRPAMWNFLQLVDAAGISDPPRTRSAYSQMEAEDFGTRSGGGTETCSEGGSDVGSIVNGNYLVYRNMDFSSGATNFQARVASATSGGNIEIRLDGTNGTLVGTCAVAGTGGWQTWVTRSCAVSGATGIHDLYLTFAGGSGYLFNVNWWICNGPSSSVSIPSAPGGLVVTAGSERAVLRWAASSGATGYNVKRATTSGEAYTTVASTAGTNYTDRGVIGGTTNYYVVSALNVGGESANSVQASVTPAVNVPSPWLAQDIGLVGLAGSASFTNGLFTLVGSGADIWDTADAFRFVHVRATGDCTIIARVASVDDHINSWSKAGVMVRESLDANAANAFIAVTPGNGVTWQYRASTGGGCNSANTTGLNAPYWVKLVRSTNVFTGYHSPDGTNWTQAGSVTLTMSSTAYIGLALTSHNLYTLCSATFDRVTAPGWTLVIPPPPTGLAATAGVEQVALNWTGSTNATSYTVKRAATSGGPYTTIANVTATNYTDTRLIGGTTCYYVVSASSLAGENGNSAQVSATPIVNVPLPWNTRDIGAAGLWGSAGVTSGVFTVTGSGADIQGTADAFRFVYVTNNGNFTISDRVVSVQNADGWSKAGIMIRDSLDSGAANAFVAVTPGNGVTWQYRSSDGGGTSYNQTTGLSAPYWVRLVRSGDTFTGYRSLDGTNWTQQGSTTITNVISAYIGLAVTAHNNSSSCMATFDNVTAPGWPLPLLTLNAVAASSSQVNLTWNALTNATSYNVKRSPTNGGPYILIAAGLTATNYADSGLLAGTTYYYVVSAMVGGSETPNSAQASATPGAPVRYTNDFSALPLAAEWVAGSVAGAPSDLTTVAALHEAATNLNAADFTAQFGASTNNPPAAASNPVWCSSGGYLQTCPTGVRFQVMIAKLVNNTGADANTLTVSYDFPQGSTNEQVNGWLTYYSLAAGGAGSWRPIYALWTNAPGGRLSATVTLESPWSHGGTLCLLWVDDNGSPSPDTGNQMDNFSATATMVASPVAILTQPASALVLTNMPASFSVAVSGSAPHYQWYHGSTPVGTDSATYAITAAQPGDAGDYFVIVSNNFNRVTSTVATLVVTQQVGWVAFNNQAPPPANVTAYSPDTARNGPFEGPLKNVLFGNTLPAFMSFTTNAGATGTAGTMGTPLAGTPADTIFGAHATWTGNNAGYNIRTTGEVAIVFTGLNPAKTYKLAATAVRGGAGGDYSNRWTQAELVNAVSYTAAHTPGVLTSAQWPALAAGQAALNTGLNITNLAGAATGDVFIWNNIVPAAGPGSSPTNGTFTVLTRQYTHGTPYMPSGITPVPAYAYGLSQVRLEEYAGAGPKLTITVTSQNPRQATISWSPAGGTLLESTNLQSWNPSADQSNGTARTVSGCLFFRVSQ